MEGHLQASGPVASFHLTRERGRRAPIALARLALDRRVLRTVPGLRFVRLFGTGRGWNTTLSLDPARTAMFAVWDDAAALAEFLASSTIAARARAAPEHYVARLAFVGAHGRGTWAGATPLSGIVPAVPATTAPVAVLTRADVRVGAWPAFVIAGRRLAPAAAGAEGLLALVGMGEAPLGRQATFSLWRDGPAVERFARTDTRHRTIAERAHERGWYRNDLFVRFVPYSLEGTWDGDDPLAERG